MRSRIIAIMVAVGILGMFSGLAAKAPPKKVVISECKDKKAPVTFDHEQHSKTLKVDCKTCHHKGTEKKCADCHKGKAEGKKLGCAEMSMTKNPFHVTCAGCHKKEKKGPTKCAECHKK